MNSRHLLSATLTLFGLAATPAGPVAVRAAAPRVVLISGEYEYSSMLTLSALRAQLEKEMGFQAVYLQRMAGEHIPGLEAIDHADLVIGIIRRMTLPAEELDHFKRYLDSGRPLIGMRTMCHAFENWKEFDHDVLGGNYHSHYRLGLPAAMHVDERVLHDPLLAGVPAQFTAEGELYKVLPLAADANPLIRGTLAGMDGEPEPTAWTHSYHGARIFFTSMGHPADFNNPAFMQLLTNAIAWALHRPDLPAAAPLAPIGDFPVKDVTLDELAQLATVTSFTVLDLRPAVAFAAGHIKKAVDLDPAAPDFSARISALDRSQFYVLYGGGSAPAELAVTLHRRGCPFVYVFTGGFAAWREAGKPMARDPAPGSPLP